MSEVRELYDNPTLAEVREVLMQNGKKSSGNWVFQCPVCHDESCDNLVFQKDAKYIKCFSCADNAGGKWVLTEITRKRGEKERENLKNIKVNIIEKFEKDSVQNSYWEKFADCNNYLLNNCELLDLLYKKRGIDKQTVMDCNIGFDKVKEEWVLPLHSLSYKGMLMGFEYRRKNFDLYPIWKEGAKPNKVRRDSGYVSDICIVFGDYVADILYIIEGFWDSYCIHQYLRNHGKTNYSVFSCSNGVGSLFNVLSRIDFSNFKAVKLILDTDKPASEVTEKIIQKYPFIKDSRKFLFDSGCKDVNEWLLKQIGGKNEK